ncbi:tetratricopeptide repeat protein [Bacteroides ihuae]|uniref:tetratricopeptide repeat protein n=1 Tax=Bacteroides ihuae TaxID=1852362 RepID=UPI0008D9319F|nr:tetratricopeptide repeat protein [Bacteroides ihuae]
MKKITTLILLCVCVITKAQSIISIQEAIANYDYETALKLIEKERTVTTKLLFQKAQALKGLNLPTDALEVFRRITITEPENQRALIEMAECYKLLGNFTDALGCYEKVLQLNPTNKYVQLQHINLLCSLERFKAGKSACDELMKNDSSVVSKRLLALCYEGLEESDSAITCYNTILQTVPEDYLSVARLANLYIKANKMEAAIKCTETYREKDSTNLFVNKQNALAYCLNKDYPIATQRYEYLVNQGDSSHLTCYYLGICYYATENFYEAHDFLNIALKNDPKNVNLLYYMARSCAKTSWKKEGVEYMNQAIALTIPSDTTLTRLYIGLADCYKLAGMPQNQIEALQEQYKYDSKNTKLLYQMGAIYQDALKNNKKAEQYLEMYLKTKPKEKTEEATQLNSKGEIEVGEAAYYNATTKRLEQIRKDRFFKEGIPEKEFKKKEVSTAKEMITVE